MEYIGGFFLLIVIAILIFVPNRRSKNLKENSIVKQHNESSHSDNLIELNILKAKRSIEKQINKSYLTGHSWILLNSTNDFLLYTFKNNGELLITNEGDVRIASYDMLEDNQSIIIRDINIEHFKVKLAKDNLLLLSKLGKNDNLLFFGNYTKFNNKSAEYINDYLSKYI